MFDHPVISLMELKQKQAISYYTLLSFSLYIKQFEFLQNYLAILQKYYFSITAGPRGPGYNISRFE